MAVPTVSRTGLESKQPGTEPLELHTRSIRDPLPLPRCLLFEAHPASSLAARNRAATSAEGSAESRQPHAPTQPGWFIRPSEPRPRASWTWIIAITAGEAKTSRISAQWISGSAIPRRASEAATRSRWAGVIDSYQPRIVSESCVPV